MYKNPLKLKIPVEKLETITQPLEPSKVLRKKDPQERKSIPNKKETSKHRNLKYNIQLRHSP
jgi:hypothetical protein